MNTFTKIKDLNKSLIGLSPDIFYVMVSGEGSNQYSSRFSPSDTVEWLMRNEATIVTSNEKFVEVKIGMGHYKLSVWRNVPERVDLMGI